MQTIKLLDASDTFNGAAAKAVPAPLAATGSKPEGPIPGTGPSAAAPLAPAVKLEAGQGTSGVDAASEDWKNFPTVLGRGSKPKPSSPGPEASQDWRALPTVLGVPKPKPAVTPGVTSFVSIPSQSLP